jgi:uncharacterized protein YecE (DUF72 family)
VTILSGTSGYNYEPWIGPFYPEDLPKKQMLSFYASRFPTVEINYSFYRRPTPKLLTGWAAQVPDAFRFGLKCWQKITHQQRLRSCDELFAGFCEAARSLGPKLGPILYQVPPNLKADQVLLREFLNVLPRDLKAAFEFRHDSWFTGETFQALSDAGCALCVAESEELVTPLERTTDWAYLRLRCEQYDDAKLNRYVAYAKAAPGDAFAYFKHEDEARGTKFAEQFAKLCSSGS